MIKIKQLSSGMKLAMEHMEGIRSATIGIWVNAGSVYEDEKTSGISHFIEHMVFKGTEKRSAGDIAREMDAIGGNLNAFTAKECTCFYAKVLDEHLPIAVDILSDLLLHSKFVDEDMEREKGVVCDEIYMTRDSSEDLVFENSSLLYFEGTSLMRPILGTEETVRSFTSDDLRAYMNRYYTAENSIVCCTGSFDEDSLCELLEKAFAEMPHGERHHAVEHKPSVGARMDFTEKEGEQIHFCLTLPGFALATQDFYAMALLSNVLGGSMSSRMFQRIREEMGLAYSVYTYPMAYRGIGCMCIYAGCGAKQADIVAKLLLEELEKLKAHGITPEEFSRSKEQLKGSYALGMESASSHMNAIGKCLLLQDKEYSYEATLNAMECVTMEDVERVMQRTFSPERLSVAVVGRVNACKDSVKRRMDAWWRDNGQTGEDIQLTEEAGR